jgi:hypothetical protein
MKSELLLKATAVHFLHEAVGHLNLSLRYAVAFENTKEITAKENHEQFAVYHQLMALEADEKARMCHIESDEMMKFMRLFFCQPTVKLEKDW